MFDIDNLIAYDQIDTLGMYDNINALPLQLEEAYSKSKQFQLGEFSIIKNVVVCGMGGSAIGADLLSTYIVDKSNVPLFVNREYHLPAWIKGPETLVIFSSHSGNTEETLAAFEEALARDCQMMALTTGGQIEKKCIENNVPVWKFNHKGQPRTAVGFSFGLLLGLFSRLGLIPVQDDNLAKAVESMKSVQKEIQREVLLEKNLAKQYARDMYGKWVVVIGSDFLVPVSRRWKGQISENAKGWAQFEFLPEADHNTLAGLEKPAELFESMITVFLSAPSDNPRNELRMKFTAEGFNSSGMAVKQFLAYGKTSLEHIWTSILFGDYVSYYLAMLNGVDPTPVDALARLKKALAG